MKQSAMTSAPSARRRSTAASTLAASRGRITDPSAARRSSTSRRRRRSTRGTGLSQARSKRSGVRMRPISSTSRKPRVVRRPVGAPFFWRIAFEPTVVPWTISPTAAGAMSAARSRSASPVTTARPGIVGGGRGLVDAQRSVGRGEHDVGERAADVNAHAHAGNARRPRRSGCPAGPAAASTAARNSATWRLKRPGSSMFGVWPHAGKTTSPACGIKRASSGRAPRRARPDRPP